jgi:hypothetical protein
MSRLEKRKAFRQADNLIARAKKDMLDWVEEIGRVPSEDEAKAWQAGYVSGINRVSKLMDGDKNNG